ncbi:penicillin-binding protein 1A [Parvibium lacunae]|uniref:Penicillin-binding protein 1A n=1 Tax=Parvibium lacunae TaxID=1888893 RepID=A0A368KZZ5_9BURK|nr:penicillin-binding protein 1A [Parvibium lacunae]RCS56591.1 penicillin-binding protein 1A [Parvibium lacunae]
MTDRLKFIRKITQNRWSKVGLWSLFSLTAVALIAGLILLLCILFIYPKLPSLEVLTDYHPKIPLRVYTADGALIGEFGEERRNLVSIQEVPEIMKEAVLAIEDDRFYQHSGVDLIGVARAALSNLMGGAKQGASTITMQVARNFFLSSERTLTRKIYEIMLAFKIEATLPKDKILELYLNQIYLGQRAYGFASASQIYFGKPLKSITLAEAAMLAGLPKAPSKYNPVVNPTRATIRQRYILQRMLELGYITESDYQRALSQKLQVRSLGNEFDVRAEYVAEMARQLVYEQYKEDTYTKGLRVYTTLLRDHQEAAYQGVRRTLMDYIKRRGYGGPEGYLDLGQKGFTDAVEDALVEFADSDNLYAAVVLNATPKQVFVARHAAEEIEISGEGLKFAAPSLSNKAAPNKQIRRGAVVRIMQNDKGQWEIVQMPDVEAGFIAANYDDGAIRALVGGFDFNRNKFNHTTQAWRQPGSSFKPFIYSAALEKGFNPATIVNDAPLSFSAAQTGSQAWEPKNYDGKFEGPMRLRNALAKSKNMVSIRVMQAVGAQYAQDYIGNFGFDSDKHPPYLTTALGAGSVTLWQMVGAYSIFANGGYRINPYFIAKITDHNGKVLAQAKPVLAGDEANRAIDSRNAFLMHSMMQDVVRYGTAARANSLKRTDLAGKTGTTNDSHDAWFAGYGGPYVGVAWIGYDQPKKLGDRETGGGLALPVWINYMSRALQQVPMVERKPPEGLVAIDGEYFYAEFTGVNSVRSLGLTEVDKEDSSSLTDNDLMQKNAPVVAPGVNLNSSDARN